MGGGVTLEDVAAILPPLVGGEGWGGGSRKLKGTHMLKSCIILEPLAFGIFCYMRS